MQVLKECKEELDCPVLFIHSIKSRIVPRAWKFADVVPVLKKGNRSIMLNYKPVSLTRTAGKILDSLTANKIRECL